MYFFLKSYVFYKVDLLGFALAFLVEYVLFIWWSIYCLFGGVYTVYFASMCCM